MKGEKSAPVNSIQKKWRHSRQADSFSNKVLNSNHPKRKLAIPKQSSLSKLSSKHKCNRKQSVCEAETELITVQCHILQ